MHKFCCALLSPGWPKRVCQVQYAWADPTGVWKIMCATRVLAESGVQKEQQLLARAFSLKGASKEGLNMRYFGCGVAFSVCYDIHGSAGQDHV